MSGYIKKIMVAIALIGLVLGGILTYKIYTVIFASNTSFTNEKVWVYIPTGSDFEAVKEQLTPLLKDLVSFETVAKKKGYTTRIKPGKYAIERGMNNNTIINNLRSNNLVINVSFNNQKTVQALAANLATQIEADSTDLITTFTDKYFLEQHGLQKEMALAMYIPNTYQFFWNTSAIQFRDRMLKEYDRFWNATRKEKANTMGLSPGQVIVLASIVYEESKKTEEQPRIAGVYLNRIKTGMPLQADPTVKFAAYQLPAYKNMIIRRVLNKHKAIVSPYNTYINKGLPPGPIAMPDIAAIDAVLNAETHEYYYFVADATHPGYHKFATTLAQHSKNSGVYRKWLDQQQIFK